jgi:hypothetical protein
VCCHHPGPGCAVVSASAHAGLPGLKIQRTCVDFNFSLLIEYLNKLKRSIVLHYRAALGQAGGVTVPDGSRYICAASSLPH